MSISISIGAYSNWFFKVLQIIVWLILASVTYFSSQRESVSRTLHPKRKNSFWRGECPDRIKLNVL